MKTCILSPDTVRLNGRCGFYDEDMTLWTALSGCGFECHFSGTRFSLTLTGDHASEIPDNDAQQARYAVYVNGKRTIDELLDSVMKKHDIIMSDTPVEADIRFIKLSECAMSTIGIRPIEYDGVISLPPARKHKLAFIGDSITCGYGTDVADPYISFRTATEDFTKSYAFRTAELLDAEISAFCVSGWGICSGYTDNDTPHTDQLIPPYYTKLGFSYQKFDDRDGLAPQDIEWDFSRYVPEVIVVNLGTNDSSYCKGIPERVGLFTREYTKFLHTVHKCDPAAKILCCMGIMNDDLGDAVETAARDFSEQSGFKDVYTLRFVPQDGSLGYGSDWHPSPATHERAAHILAEKLEDILDRQA